MSRRGRRAGRPGGGPGEPAVQEPAEREETALLIIWGLRVFYRTAGHGVFHCRRCGGDRRYRLRSGRRFGTLFFIPVIPLNKAGEHVQCLTCMTRYHTDALALPTAEQMQAALPAGMRAAASAMLRAGDPGSSPSRRRAIDAITGAGAQHYDDAALDGDLARPPEHIVPALRRLGGQLAIQAREWFLAEVVRIGVADGEVVRVSSRRGSIEVPVRLETSLRPGLAFMSLHFPDQASTNVLTIDATDPKSGTAEFKASAIRVDKLAAQVPV